MDERGAVVGTTNGPVRGTSERGIGVWRGVRYAAPPTGELRFRAPVRPESWTEPADASRFGAVEPQAGNPIVRLGTDVVFDEDCLFLNVFSPAADDARRPVMVWLHGGAYMIGSSSQPLYDGTELALSGDVVVVTINYRIGAFGFIDLSSFSTDGDVFESNLGLRDIIAALEWVRDNIAAFGGDPDSVTIFGESAGGGLVTTLMTTPSAFGLFHRAIAESSPATSVYGPERARSSAELLLKALNLSADRVRELRHLPADALRDAAAIIAAEVPIETPGTLALAPVVDGELVPHYPVGAFQRGLAHRVPLLIGTNRDEASAFRYMKSPLMPITQDAIHAMFEQVATEHPDLELPDEAQITSAYTGFPSVLAGMGVARDAAFRMPTLWVADAHASVAPVWLYRFDFAPAMLRLLRLGASHGTELPYVWGNLTHNPKDITFLLGGRRAGARLSQRMQARWVAFARGGEPVGPEGEPEWPRYDAEARATMVFDTKDRVEEDLDATLRAAWGDKVIAFL